MELAERLSAVFWGGRTGGNFAEFYGKHERLVRSTLYTLVPEPDVDDLVQQVFLKAWLNRKRFRGDAKVGTWLTRIAINAAQDFWRKNTAAKTTTLDALENVGEGGAAGAAISQVDARMVLRGALDSLPLEHRTVISLFYFQEFSLEEIAETLQEPVGTVKSRLHYAKSQLRKALTTLGVEL